MSRFVVREEVKCTEWFLVEADTAEEALQNVISQESWKQYLALDEICNELECARYKAMYLAGASDYEKLSK